MSTIASLGLKVPAAAKKQVFNPEVGIDGSDLVYAGRCIGNSMQFSWAMFCEAYRRVTGVLLGRVRNINITQSAARDPVM